MSPVQLSFSLRVSAGVKTVHLLGSWDNYVGQLPLSKDKNSKSGTAWKGTFRFQNSMVEAGKRYWYYYIIDGYHISHNPSEESTTEPTTGRELNILDVTEESSKKSSSKSSSKSSRRSAVDIPKGRPLSVSQIKAPKPVSPHATKHILNSDYYGNEELDELAARFGNADLDDDVISDFSTSPVSSNGSSLSYRSDSSSPSSDLSGYSTPSSDCSSCTCERYGITRKGDRVKIDCGGARCGYEDSSDCASDVSDDEEEAYEVSSRRNGIVVA